MTNNRVGWYLIPSSYGFAIWAILLCLVNFTVVLVQPDAFALLAYVPLCFFFSNLINGRLYSKINFKTMIFNVIIRKSDINLFWLSGATGFVGLFVYVRDFGEKLGGILGFIYTFLENPLEIRALAEEISSNGFQISYLSWVFIFYGVFFLSIGFFKKSVHKNLIRIMIALSFFLNLLFVDRTRPITIFVVCALIYLFVKLPAIKRPTKYIFYLLLSPFVIFVAQAIFTQKYDVEDGIVSNIVVYIFGGFGYFSALLYDVSPHYELTRTFAPIFKVLQSIGIVRSVPPEILSFKDIPFSTNVGTFLEPFLSDGGPLLVVFGTPVMIFSVDYLALRSLSSRTVFGVFFWANLVLLAMLSFFVPKFNSTYLYLFGLIYLVMSILNLTVTVRKNKLD